MLMQCIHRSFGRNGHNEEEYVDVSGSECGTERPTYIQIYRSLDLPSLCRVCTPYVWEDRHREPCFPLVDINLPSCYLTCKLEAMDDIPNPR